MKWKWKQAVQKARLFHCSLRDVAYRALPAAGADEYRCQVHRTLRDTTKYIPHTQSYRPVMQVDSLAPTHEAAGSIGETWRCGVRPWLAFAHPLQAMLFEAGESESRDRDYWARAHAISILCCD